ncbi:MAG: SUF system NifU family Fe-S cluster assembly protein [Dehalococcoidia bacterium]|nr:SUF system NifU family Fe-S cluster assembly protein [Dehalococcoidia bacterium]
MDSPSIDELYHDAILDHRRNPRNQAVLESPDASAKAVNPFCGDEVDIQLAFLNGRVSDVGVQAIGCSINQSTASMLSEAVVGKTNEEIRRLATAFEGIMDGEFPSASDADAMYDLPTLSAVREYPVRIKCALLAWSALEDALGGCGWA